MTKGNPALDASWNKSWKYRVEIDGKTAFESKELNTYPNREVMIDVAIPSLSKTLVLIIDPCGDQNSDHSMWGYPMFVRKEDGTKTRSFTDTNGRIIEATVIQAKNNHVTLHVPASGQKFVFPFSKFCAADIAYLKGLVTTAEVAASASPIDVKLDYLAKGAYLKVQAYRPIVAPTTGKRPSSITKAPNDISTAKFGDMMALYGEIKMGPRSERTHAFILDKAHSNSQRLFVDSNANGDLTDDPPARWEPGPTKSKHGSKGPLYLGAFQLDIKCGDESHVAQFNAYIRERNERFVFYSDYARSGTVTINGKTTHAELTDHEGKGDFSAHYNNLLLDLSGDGRFDWKTEQFMIKDAYRINGVAYEVSGITPSGASFQLVKSNRSPAK
jgi:hypothetical protein